MNGMNNMMGNNVNNIMGNQGAPNNGLYVPQTGGTSIASIIQNKKQGGSGVPANGYPSQSSGGPSGYSQGGGNMSGYDRQRAAAAYGYSVDHNGYPVPADRRGEPLRAPARDPRMVDTRSVDSMRGSRVDPHSDTNSEYERIMELANDVNNSLEVLEENEKRKRRSRRDSESDSESVDSQRSRESKERNGKGEPETETEEEIENEEETVAPDPIATAMQDGYGMMIIEPLLLLTIYVILSQPFAINFASYYIDQLNPNEDGAIPLSGIIIYGVILVIMFMVLRRVVEYKLQ
jgi:hypothetical protein